MRLHSTTRISGFLAGVLVMTLVVTDAARGQNPVLTIHTEHGSDTMWVGEAYTVAFDLDAMGHSLVGVSLPFEIQFSNGNTIGEVTGDNGFDFSPEAYSVFATLYLSENYPGVTDPETLFVASTHFGGPTWDFAAEYCHFPITPTDSGHITFQDIVLPPANVLEVIDDAVVSWPLDWNQPTFVVLPCPVEVMGDLNGTGTVNLTDVIVLVNYVFKMGPPPQPMPEAADVNCDGTINAGDLIYMVNYSAKSGPAPCGCFPVGT